MLLRDEQVGSAVLNDLGADLLERLAHEIPRRVGLGPVGLWLVKVPTVRRKLVSVHLIKAKYSATTKLQSRHVHAYDNPGRQGRS